MRKLFIFLIVIIVALVLIKRKDMTWRQSILKTIYPLIMLKGKLFPSAKDIQVNKEKKVALNSFYDLKAIATNGDTIAFSDFFGKKIMIINTASDCGFTAQYDELEKLHQQYKNKLVMIAFPANDFKEQEKADNAAIADFCKINYGISFQLMQKSSVIKGAAQNQVYQWLTQSQQNGWCNQQPLWNFSKYLVDEKGVLTHFFSQSVSPLSKEVRGAVEGEKE